MARCPACPGEETWVRGVLVVPAAPLHTEWLFPLVLCSGAAEETPSCYVLSRGMPMCVGERKITQGPTGKNQE